MRFWASTVPTQRIFQALQTRCPEDVSFSWGAHAATVARRPDRKRAGPQARALDSATCLSSDTRCASAAAGSCLYLHGGPRAGKLSHAGRGRSAPRACPPRSHSLMVTAPLVTLRMLKPTVGIMSSWKPPVATTLTSDVLPAFCRPIKDSSISFLKKRLFAQAQLRLSTCTACCCTRILAGHADSAAHKRAPHKARGRHQKFNVHTGQGPGHRRGAYLFSHSISLCHNPIERRFADGAELSMRVAGRMWPISVLNFPLPDVQPPGAGNGGRCL